MSFEFLQEYARDVRTLFHEERLLRERLEAAQQALTQAYDATLEGWVRALDLRDRETEGHSQRVTEMTVRLARHMGLSGEALAHVRRGALLHDIGKMAIPDRILHKPGALDAGEWEVMRRHPVYGYEFLHAVPYLQPALDIPYAHHERWDGTGYPRGLRGEQIPLPARIFSIVDIYDALRSDRPYRPAWPEEQVHLHLKELAGSHLDPAVVHGFMELVGREGTKAHPAP